MGIDDITVNSLAQFLRVDWRKIHQLAKQAGVRLYLISYRSYRYAPLTEEDAMKIIRLFRLQSGERILKKKG